MSAAARALWQLLRNAPTTLVAAVALSMLLAGLTEGVGYMLIVPMLASLEPQALSSAGHAQHAAMAWVPAWLSARSLPELLAVFVGLMGLRSGILVARDRLSHRLQHQVVDKLRERVFSALLQVEWRWLMGHARNDQASLLLTEVNRVGAGLHQGLGLLANLAGILAVALTSLVLSWPTTMLVLSAGVLALALQSRQRRQAVALGQQLSQANRALHGNVHDSLAGIQLAKMCGTESQHLARFHQVTEALRRQQAAFIHTSSQQRAAFQVVAAVVLALILYIGLTQWHTPLPVLMAQVALFARLSPRLTQAQEQLHQGLHALPAYTQTQALLDACAAAAEPGVLPTADAAPLPVHDHIALRDVVVQHAGRPQAALHHIDLVLPARTTTAVVGESGAGKSTLANVLAGLLAPDQGSLVIDGQALSDTQRRLWRRQVAYVTQDVYLFHGTVRQNLLWASPNADDATLHQALRQAAADFVLALPQGLDTQVGDGGQRLSGGERQRLALARALLSRPSLLILDEATSALDTDNELRIRRALEQLHGDLTVLLIGHRLATLEHADQVIVMAQGRIAEQGTWSTLRANTAMAR